MHFICFFVFPCVAGCRLHSEHPADQCQRPGSGTTGEGSPSAAAGGHGKLLGALRSHSESLTWSPVHVLLSKRLNNEVITTVLDEMAVLVWLDSFLLVFISLVCVSKVADLDQLNIIHVTGTKGKVG